MCDSGRDETKKKYVQLYMDGMPGYCVPLSEIGFAISAELEGADVGDGYEVKIVEMTDDEYDQAPEEFTGW